MCDKVQETKRMKSYIKLCSRHKVSYLFLRNSIQDCGKNKLLKIAWPRTFIPNTV